MPTKSKLKVVSAVGTFTRTTARTYTHLVVMCGERAEILEAARLSGLAHARAKAARYREVERTGVDPEFVRRPEDRATVTAWIAEGQYREWVASSEATAATLEADGPITTDAGTDWIVSGWCGRLDLARKLFARTDTDRYDSPARYRHAAIVEVATGAIVAQR